MKMERQSKIRKRTKLKELSYKISRLSIVITIKTISNWVMDRHVD